MSQTLNPPLAKGSLFESNIPARMDRLPWSAWHWRVVIALGITWVLDGLEVTLVGAVGVVLHEPGTLGLNDAQLGISASAYLAGAVIGALVFGRLTDMLGRKRLFFITLSIYLAATALTALSWNLVSFALFRALTGAGIGGEYAAINSAIDELLPARVRGRADLAINSTYWAGNALGAFVTLILLNEKLMPHSIGWRLCFGLGAALGLGILFTRRHLPESPRWLLLHGRVDEAEQVVTEIESHVKLHHSPLPEIGPASRLEVKGSVGFRTIVETLFHKHRKRAALGFILMVAQAFAYNGIFFTYSLVLNRFYGVRNDRVGSTFFRLHLATYWVPFVWAICSTSGADA